MSSLLRARLVGVLSVATSLAISGAVLAAPPAPAAADGPPSGNKRLNRQSAATAFAELARARAHAGDCKGALDAFDQALRSSIDPTLRRDRGLCHEQLDDPFPAIDDYRAYLLANPEGPESDEVRERLGRLEAQVASSDKLAPPTPAGAGLDTTPSVSVEVSAKVKSLRNNTKVEDAETDDLLGRQALASPVREGSGLVIGPYFGIRRFARAELGTSEAVGAAFRYSLGKTSTVLAEVGYVVVNSGDPTSSAGGPGVFAGYEARIPLTKYTTDAFLLGGGLGFERYSKSSAGVVVNSLIPRGRLGYRHVFGSSIGVEVTGDLGMAYLFASEGPIDSPVTVVFGGYLALVIGF